MINNRQGGRRRGRGGQRPQNLGSRSDGNRQDNRQRGNAAQLLEKYKSMARDAQLSGDRVQTEYYLQYADHYYRILGESRARFEEQRRARGDVDGDDGDDDQMDGDDQRDDGDDDRQDRNDRPERNDRYERDRPQPRESRDRFERNDRPERSERNERPERSDRNERPERNERAPTAGRTARPEPAERAPRRPRYSRDGNGEDFDGVAPQAANESIAFDALPPAIGRDTPAIEDEAEDAPRPKRRAPRKPRAAGGDEDVAPAA